MIINEELKQLIKLLKRSISRIDIINQLDANVIQMDVSETTFNLYSSLLNSLSTNFNKVKDSYLAIFNSKYFSQYFDNSLTSFPLQNYVILEESKTIENIDL